MLMRAICSRPRSGVFFVFVARKIRSRPVDRITKKGEVAGVGQTAAAAVFATLASPSRKLDRFAEAVGADGSGDAERCLPARRRGQTHHGKSLCIQVSVPPPSLVSVNNQCRSQVYPG
jgi:hypothetical protein